VAETIPRLAAIASLAVVTSRLTESAVRILDGLGLAGRFSSFVGIDRVSRPKPDPEALLLALSELGVAATAAVMVGDTPDDVTAGKEAGTWTVGVTTGAYGAGELARAGADEVVPTLGDLLAGRSGQGRSKVASTGRWSETTPR
jgi:pyrophosphatase PpaX